MYANAIIYCSKRFYVCVRYDQRVCVSAGAGSNVTAEGDHGPAEDEDRIVWQ